VCDQPLEPCQFIAELRSWLRVAVRQIQAADQNPCNCSFNVAALSIRWIAWQRTARHDGIRSASQDCDPVPTALALPHSPVPDIAQGSFGEVRLARLQFLQTNHVRRALLDRSDIVFTGGFSLHEAKRHQHNNVHPFPSGVDVAHFRPARGRLAEPADQRGIPHPRLGFYGVIDERLDTELLAQLAVLRPEWQIVLVGPTVKVDPAALPQAPNIHYLGGKSYADLPSYLSGWDVALMPFARNEATRFISPTKTPEYLAGGKPVVSTPITDVVRQYGQTKAVRIAGCPTSFAAAVTDALRLAGERGEWLAEADEILATTSWDDIWSRMAALIEEVAESKGGVHGEQARAHWS
jgi:UDP-galactopyranose mutase